MSQLLTIDPGTRVIGWAYGEGREMYLCGVSEAKGSEPGYWCAYHDENLCKALGFDWRTLPVRVSERMKSRGKFSPVDENDLMDVNIVAGHLANSFVTAQEWKGTISRPIEQARTWDKLSDRERLLLRKPRNKSDIIHNAWSAVGIFCHVLKRKAR